MPKNEFSYLSHVGDLTYLARQAGEQKRNSCISLALFSDLSCIVIGAACIFDLHSRHGGA